MGDGMTQPAAPGRGLSRVVFALSIVSLAFVLLSGLFVSFLTTAFLCFDVCPQTSDAWISVISLGANLMLPSLGLTLVAWFVAVWYLAQGGLSRRFGIVVFTPLIIASIMTALALAFLHTGLAPTNTSKAQVWPWLTLSEVALMLCWPISLLIGARRRFSPSSDV